jgi:SAM-dependent methyltransferase
MHRTDYLIAQRCRGKVLELGCRAGRRSLLIDMMGREVLGIDTDREQIRIAQSTADACGLEHSHFRCADEDWSAHRQFETVVVSSTSGPTERALFEVVDGSLGPTAQLILAIPDSTHLLGSSSVAIADLEALRARIRPLFPVVEEIHDDFTPWRIFIFRRSSEPYTPEPGEGMRGGGGTSVPKVSVIMTTYNRGRMIHNAIDSVLAQSYPNVELIVVNDGSTDDTREVLASYGSRLTALHQVKNEGIATATNTGLAAASGDYVQRFDDDDIMFPRKIECQIRKYAAHPALGLVYTAAYVMYSLSDQKMFRRFGRFIPLSEYALAPTIEILNSATLVKKQCMDEIGFFDTRLTGMAECDRFMRIMARHEYAFLPVPGVLYLKHGENHTLRKQTLIKESARHIHENTATQLPIDELFKNISETEDQDERRMRYSLAFLRRGKYGLAKGCYESACRDFERALAIAPENVAARKHLEKAQRARSDAAANTAPDTKEGREESPEPPGTQSPAPTAAGALAPKGRPARPS